MRDSNSFARTESGSVRSDVAALSTLDELEQLISPEVAGRTPTTAADFLITHDRISEEAGLLGQVELSSELAKWVDGYSQVGDRHPYLWTWCQQGVELTTLPSVSQSVRHEVSATKVLGIMFDVLLDDVADQGGNVALLDELVALPFGDPPDWSRFTAQEQKYAAFAEAVWSEVQRRVRHFCRHAEFQDLLRFDYLQLMNTMRYAHLLNRFPCMLNLAEHDLYLPHNMHMMVSATMDVMCSPTFDFEEIGLLREAMWHAQYMGRIGNLVTTWQRELYEGDFSSGVFAHAVMHGDLSLKMLVNSDREIVRHQILDGQHEEYFLRLWQAHRRRLLVLQDSLDSVDLGSLVNGLERLICLHLASRGMK